MTGSDDSLPMLDWPITTPRTQAFLSSILGGDGLLPPENGDEEVPLLPAVSSSSEKLHNSCIDSIVDGEKIDGSKRIEDLGDESTTIAATNVLSFPPKHHGFRSGLAERMAARGGFNAPKLNTNQIRSSNNLQSSQPPSEDAKSHQIPLSPGFSPSAFLDSPVFLFNSLPQPSPTTGKITLGQGCGNNTNLAVPGFSNRFKDVPPAEVETKTISLKPQREPPATSFSSASNTVHHREQSLQNVEVIPTEEELSNQSKSINIHLQKQQQQDQELLSAFSEPSDIKDSSTDYIFDIKSSEFSAIIRSKENSPPPVDQLKPEDQKVEFSSNYACAGSSAGVSVKPSEDDGYNWRKYGQKHVKGSEFPRSYYKCTHLNCQVKKKVERAPGGQVTEIIYKGVHNHSRPPLNRRISSVSVMPSHSLGGEMKNDVTTSSTSFAPLESDHFCDPSVSGMCEDIPPRFESSDTLDVSSGLSNDGEEDNGGTTTRGGGGYGATVGVDKEESELKRRKLELSTVDMNSSASRAVREPRVVVQTTSEVDILDDGYRWRKYGQKVVKGNPNPRSYYKCTSVGCTVRKHVERASHDLKAVITTYEGKHNHVVPAARNSCHSSSVISAAAATETTNASSHQAQESLTRFDIPQNGFSFGLTQPNLSSLAMGGLVPCGPPHMKPHLYLDQQGMFLLPKGEPEDDRCE